MDNALNHTNRVGSSLYIVPRYDNAWFTVNPYSFMYHSFDVADEGFKCHISQQNTDYHVEDWGPWDNSLFGLYRSLVGPDEAKDDFFEHLD